MPHRQDIAALSTAVQLIFDEGVDSCYQGHARIADYRRNRLLEIGYCIFPAPVAIPYPTVTAIYVPERISWQDLDYRSRQHRLVVGGNYGALAEKVFRIGHIETQADMSLERRLWTLQRR
ncbi:MAG: hypothetical protein HPY59_12465 [Anaerolineae bacterium]|nr:hypothetical protein [Anaerolineae bacterium]